MIIMIKCSLIVIFVFKRNFTLTILLSITDEQSGEIMPCGYQNGRHIS